ncbi:hypothetical protein ACHAWF_004326 [Thalassiosira exigua]
MTTRRRYSESKNEKPLLDERQMSSVECLTSSSWSSSSSSLRASPNAMKSCYPSLSDAPHGKFLGCLIWKNDPSSEAIKIFYACLTILGILYMVFHVFLMVNVFGMDGGWDEQHGFDNRNASAFPELISITLGLSPFTVYAIFGISLGSYGMLMAVDWLMGALVTPDKKRTYPYPPSWRTDNDICYSEMFSEPTRWGRLLRRPGNTLSNGTYFFASICILSSGRSIFWLADVLFGTMLFCLAVFSNLWHASNAPWSQYPDLWAMDSCIAYLNIRCVCLGGLILVQKMTVAKQQNAQQLAAVTCALVYSATIMGLAMHQWNIFQKGWLHGRCPFSARARLIGKGDVWGQGQQDCHVLTVCAFAALPLFYTALPTIIYLTLGHSMGSVAAANWTFWSLVFAWTYRMWDRWLLDGCIFIRWFAATPPGKEPTVVRTIGSAGFSPTAVFHFFTGLTLLAGYMHSRSWEDVMTQLE